MLTSGLLGVEVVGLNSLNTKKLLINMVAKLNLFSFVFHHPRKHI